MAQQLGMFKEEVRTIARTPRGDIVYFPAVFDAGEAASLCSELLATTAWSKETMKMYDKLVDVPRLVAWYRDEERLPQALERIRERTQLVLRRTFNAVSLNYYRDGTDSVAWHSDHNEELVDDPVVALVSVGATREMQFRTKAIPRRQLRCDLEPGSILAMRGDVQSHYEHHVPKVGRPTSARISVALRTKVASASVPSPSASRNAW
ncbi:MAG: alpha-ketoglutarate-dependent dioxygenase AlkB [Candidatus Baltobacteraceae bacterium]